MEGVTVYFKPKGKSEYETRFYSILSTEKAQDGQVVYVNTKMILEDLAKELEDGSEFEVEPAKLEIVEDTDGCAVQYRSGTSLYMLSRLAFENDLIFCRAIDAEGHGKKLIDGLSGKDKRYMDKELRGNVEYQPEAMEENKRQVLLIDVKDGVRQDFAEIACEMLSHPSRKHGVETVPCNKPRTKQTKNEMAITVSKYLVRDKSRVKHDGMKMEGKGFNKKRKRAGMKYHYHFRFEKALGLVGALCFQVNLHDQLTFGPHYFHIPQGKFAFRRIACMCPACAQHLQLPFPERYGGSAEQCILAPMMKMKDKNGTVLEATYNDWHIGSLKERKDSNTEHYNECVSDAMQELGKSISNQISKGNYCADWYASVNLICPLSITTLTLVLHSVQDDPNYLYYICELTGEPWEVTEDGDIEVDTITTSVKKGDFVCEGLWLESLPDGKNWYTMTEPKRKCLVKLEQVAIPNLKLRPRSDANPLRKGMKRYSVNIAEQRGAWRISDEDHAFLLEESRIREDENCYDYDPDIVNKLRREDEQKPKMNTWVDPNEVIELEDDDDDSSDDDSGDDDNGE